jgi:hypothetical protein
MITFAFLALLAATLAFGAYLGTVATRASQQMHNLIDTTIDEGRRMDAICDEADMAETSCDWPGTI